MSEDGKGNGADLAAIYGAILALDRKLNSLAGEVAGLRTEMRTENARTRADIAAVRGEVTALRSEVTMYHASVVGHGVLISELDERVGRLERGEPPKAA